MDNQYAFLCPHCGQKIVVSKSNEPVGFASDEPSPDEIPTTAVAVNKVVIPLKDVILEPEPIEEIELDDAIEEIATEPIEEYDEIEELNPDDLRDLMPDRSQRPARPVRPARPERPERGRPRPGAGSGARPRPDRPERPTRGAAPARPPRGRSAGPAEFDVVLDPIPADLEDIAFDLIMDLAGVNEREAERILSGKFIVPVRGVTREEAEQILADFEAEGITGSVKRPKPRR